MHEYKLEAGLLEIHERARFEGKSGIGAVEQCLNGNGLVEQKGRDILVYTDEPGLGVETPWEEVPAISVEGHVTMDDMRALDTYGVLARMGEPQRLYHNIDHLETMLGALNEYLYNVDHSFTQQDLKYILYFIMYHDSVYDIPAAYGENERQSRDLFRQHHGADDPLYFVDRMIMATGPDSGHYIYGASGLFKEISDLCLDLDLYNIGQDHTKFMDATVHVIVERVGWSGVGPEAFAASHKFLSSLAAGGLFKTLFFRSKYEEQVTENLRLLREYACPSQESET